MMPLPEERKNLRDDLIAAGIDIAAMMPLPEERKNRDGGEYGEGGGNAAMMPLPEERKNHIRALMAAGMPVPQ